MSITESSQAAKSGGCFSEETTVETSSGARVRLADLRVGDRVLALDLASGRLTYSEVLLFLDRDPLQRREFLRLRTAGGRSLTVTPSHLLLVQDAGRRPPQAVFAARVRLGDLVLVPAGDGAPQTDTVVAIEEVLMQGVFAPLTREGTIVADGVVASCYAVVDSQWLAHLTYAPFRLMASVRNLVGGNDTVSYDAPVGVHWYAKALYALAQFVLPGALLYRDA